LNMCGEPKYVPVDGVPVPVPLGPLPFGPFQVAVPPVRFHGPTISGTKFAYMPVEADTVSGVPDVTL